MGNFKSFNAINLKLISLCFVVFMLLLCDLDLLNDELSDNTEDKLSEEIILSYVDNYVEYTDSSVEIYECNEYIKSVS